MDWVESGLFLLAAVALLGSPGPAIAAIVAVGRANGWRTGLSFYGGLQVGLALAAAASAAGLFTLVQAVPGLLTVMTVGAAGYLIYLAFKIATAPVGDEIGRTAAASSVFAGFVLGLSNPKAYAAFISLFASFVLIPASTSADNLSKWLICVAVMITVDIIWLYAGVQLGRIQLSERAERLLNYFLAGSIVLATFAAFL